MLTTNKPVVRIHYKYDKSQYAIMYLDKLRNTHIDHSQKVELDQSIPLVVVYDDWQMNTLFGILLDTYYIIELEYINKKRRSLEHSKTYFRYLYSSKGFGILKNVLESSKTV